MNRHQFDHAVRAAGAVAGVNEVIVIGSQAAHASLSDGLPEAAMRSVEADIVVRGDREGEMADLIDGSIGEASMFHQTFGFYAQGVSIETALLPDGWEERLVRYETPATNGVVAWCLSLPDLFVSKALAGRPKDFEFCRALLELGAIETDYVLSLIEATDTEPGKKHLAQGILRSN